MLHDIFEPCPRIATETEIDEMLDNVFDNNCPHIASEEEIGEMLDDVFTYEDDQPFPPDLNIASEEEIDEMLNNIFV